MRRYQSGATLIVALVLLAIVTVLGAAGMRGTNLEMKMIATARDRVMAFEAAESTLRAVELDLINNPPALASIAGASTSTYTPDCVSGNCFGGSYDPADPYKSCRIFKPNAGVTQFWEQKSLWDTEGKHGVKSGVKVALDKTINTQYMVEFMCFTLKERGLKGTIDDKEAGDENLIYMPLFRITAIAKGPGDRSEVMTQAMVKVNVD